MFDETTTQAIAPHTLHVRSSAKRLPADPMSQRISKHLLNTGIATRALLDRAISLQQRENGGRRRALHHILIEDFKFEADGIMRAICELYAIRQIDLQKLPVSDSQLEFIRKSLDAMPENHKARLLSKRILPFGPHADNPEMLVALVADPLDPETTTLLRPMPFRQIEAVYCANEQLDNLIQRVMLIRNDFLHEIEESVASVDAIEEEDVAIDETVLDAEINRSLLTNLIEGTLIEAVRRGASDLHIIPKGPSLTELYFRIDGKLQLWHAVTSVRPESIAAVVKDRSLNIDRFNRNIAQDGFIQRRIDNHYIRFRVSVLPISGAEVQRRFESVVIRVLDDRKVITDLTELGLQEQAARDFKAAIAKPQGMIILTGPTGSGKSTTLIAALHTIMDPSRNIVSVEEPVEYLIQGARQVKIGPKLDFDSALRAVLRHDPDIVMVGEIRDLKSAQIAISLANTGHLTFTTLHTNDAPSAIARLYMLGVEPFLIANATNLVVGQRLVRRLCEHCKSPVSNPDLPLAQFLGFKDEEIAGGTFFQNVGCDRCYEGFQGRISIMEAMLMTPAIRNIILASRGFVNESEIRQEAINNGMLTLRASGRSRVLEGKTTLAEVAAATME